MDNRNRARSYRMSLARTVGAMDLPFGYTLTIWSSGALAVARYGVPTRGDVLVFLLGGLSAYLLATWIALAHLGAMTPARIRRSSSFNVLSIVAAIVVSGLTGVIQTSLIGFAVAGFTGTMVYLLGISLFNWLLVRGARSRERDRRSE